MADNLKNIEVLEKELASYRAKFQESSQVLNDLAKIQSDFSGLAQKYKQIQAEHENLTEFIQESRTNAANLQDQLESAVKQINSAGEHFQDEFTSLQHEIVENFTQFQKELNQQFKKSEYELRQLSIDIKNESEKAVEQVIHSNESNQIEFAGLKQEILENFIQFEKELNQRFEKLENESRQNFVDIRTEIETQIKTQSERYQQELEAKVEQRLEDVTKSQEQIELSLKRLEDATKNQEEIELSLKRLESELNDTKASINQVKQSTSQQLEHIPNRFAIVDEYQAQTNQKILFIGVGSLLAILLAFVSLFMPPKNNTPSPQSQTSQLINPNR